MTSAPSSEPRSGGLAFALWSLVKPPAFEAAVPAQPGLRYLEGPRRGVAPLCDVYLPATKGPHRSVVVVHGGGFVIGHRRMKPVRLLATRLCERGYAVCSVDYRLLLRGGGLDAQVFDVDAAARFWRARCERFDCDPARISMAGLSAGAALMMLHAGQSALPYERLVSIYGPADFARVSGRRASLLLSAVLGTRDRRTWARMSPVRHALVPSPLLILHGTADQLVPVQHATHLYEARASAGLPTELELVEGMRHGWLNDASLPETEQALGRILGFLDAGA